MWYVYMVRCNDGSLYTGISTNVSKRVDDHNSSSVGAKYTKSRRPVVLVWQSAVMERNTASSLEYHMKRQSKQKKESYIQEGVAMD